MLQIIKEITNLNIPDQKKIEIISLLINSSNTNQYSDLSLPTISRQQFLRRVYSKYNLHNLSLAQARDYINANIEEISRGCNAKPNVLMSRSAIDIHRAKLKKTFS